MHIGIIGAGNIGGTLTKRLTALGHHVEVANSRGPETLRELAAQTGAKPVEVEDAVRNKDVVVVTIPEKALPDLPRDLFRAARADTVVVDTGNYYPQRDGRIEGIEAGMPESRWASKQLGHKVVKAFNTIRAQHLMERGKPSGEAGRIALPIAGDDSRDKQIVMQLVDELGFDPVDAGSLDESWRQQPGSPVYAADLGADGVRTALAQAKKERPPQFSASK